MSKPFSYWVRLALVATLSTLITFNPVLAGRWMDKFLNRSGCIPAPCCEVAAPTNCTPVSNCEAACPVTSCQGEMSSPCSAGAVPSTQSMPSITPMQSAPPEPFPSTSAPSKQIPSEPAQTQSPAPQTVPQLAPSAQTPPAVVAPTVEPTVIEPKVTPPANVVQETTPPVPADAVPSPFPETKNVAPVEPVKDPVPEPAPSVPPQLETKPETKAEPTDLFAPEPSKPAVEAEEPAKAPPKSENSINDLFGAPTEAAPTEPAKPAAVEPPAEKSESLNDLFSDPKPTTTPAEPKAEVQKTNESDLEGLFGKPITVKLDDQADSKTEEELDNARFFENLFGKNEEAKARARVTAEREKAVREHAEKEAATVDAKRLDEAIETQKLENATIESIFESSPKIETTKKEDSPKQEVSTPVPTDSQPAAPSIDQEKGKQEPSTDIDLDKLFGIGSFSPNGSFNGAEFRQWVDNTGAYAIKARLSVIYIDKIKLLKENGRFTTVPLSRLSERDFAYVQWVANSLTGEQASMMVKKEKPSIDQEPTR